MLNLRRLLPEHMRILELTAAGHNLETIASTVGRHPKSIRLVQQTPIFQHELSKYQVQSREMQLSSLDREAHQGKALSILEQASVRAAETLEELISAPDPNIRLRSASAILDRVLSKGDNKGGTVVNITIDQANLINQAIQEVRHARVSRPNRETAVDSETNRPELRKEGWGDVGSANGSDADASGDEQGNVLEAGCGGAGCG